MQRLNPHRMEDLPRPAPMAIHAWAAFILLLLAWTAPAYCADPVTWKLIPQATFRIDDRAPKQWNLYRVDKKTDSLLVQIGGRFLLVYPRDETVFEVSPADLSPKGSDLLWRAAEPPGKVLASAQWSSRDVGIAVRIFFRLTAEGRSVDIQLPHSAGFRPL